MKIEMLNKSVIGSWSRNMLAMAVLAASAVAGFADDTRLPEVPEQIAPPAEAKVHFRGFARGVQIYTWNGFSWGAAVPEATLFDEDGNIVMIHFGGPTWQSNSGSAVVGALPPKAVTVDTNAIPWLLLDALTTKGPGILAETSHIHRVNTVGGKAPSQDGVFVGQVARVPYTADYFFYRLTGDEELTNN